MMTKKMVQKCGSALAVMIVLLALGVQIASASCGISSSGNWSSVSWTGCSGTGGLPGPGDDTASL